MRPKFVFALILSAALVLGAALLLKQPLGNAATPPPVTESATPAPAVSVAPPPAPAPAVTHAPTPEQREAAIDAETGRLQQWSMNDDPASLSNILADLTNPDKEIREAAVEAAEQFGSTNAIPALKAAAANTTDTGEQAALLEAADFLSLPSISDSGVQLPGTPEQIQAAAERQARRQAQMQRRSPNQNSPAAPNN